MKACWVWGLQGVERHLRGPSTSRQEPSGAPCSLEEEDLAPSAQDQGSPERPEGGAGEESAHWNHSGRSLSRSRDTEACFYSYS